MASCRTKWIKFEIFNHDLFAWTYENIGTGEKLGEQYAYLYVYVFKMTRTPTVKTCMLCEREKNTDSFTSQVDKRLKLKGNK